MKFFTILLATFMVASVAIAGDTPTAGNMYYQYYSCTPTAKSSEYKNISIFLSSVLKEAVVYGSMVAELKKPEKVKNSLQITYEHKDSSLHMKIISGFDVTLEGQYFITTASTTVKGDEGPDESFNLSFKYTKSSPNEPKVKFTKTWRELDWNVPMDQGEVFIDKAEETNFKCKSI